MATAPETRHRAAEASHGACVLRYGAKIVLLHKGNRRTGSGIVLADGFVDERVVLRTPPNLGGGVGMGEGEGMGLGRPPHGHVDKSGGGGPTIAPAT